MKKRNIYKDLVWAAALLFLLSKGIGLGKAYVREQKTYSFHIRADKDLTADMLEEFRKLPGICSFEPMDTAAVTISLGSYTLQTELIGLDLETYPLKWQRIPGRLESAGEKEGTSKAVISMGNTPALFFGEEAFSFFTDKSGYPPLKSQVEKWMEQYQTLELRVADEEGRERRAKICGILSDPKDMVCMDKTQMKETFGGLVHAAGGFMETYGHKNMEKARGLLESAGFLTQDSL